MLLFFSGAVFGQCPAAPGNPAVYGNGSWIGYVYANFSNSANAFSATYRGYVTEPETFNRDYASAGPAVSTVCGTYTEQFAIRYRMQKNFTAGYYTFTVGGDDGYRFSIDGGANWTINNWNDHGYTTSVSSAIYLSGSTDLVLEYYENGGLSQVSFSYVGCYGTSTAPTSISGTTATCSGGGTTLTATGGTLAPGSVYQWGTGNTVGNNTISGETGVSITVYPTTNTTYWVRRVDPTTCGGPTSGVTQAVTVTPISTAPTTINGTTSICQGSSTTLTASGGTLASGSTYEWGTGSVGSNIISGQNAASITVTPATTTTYWVRRLNGSPCASATSGISATVNVTPITGDQVSYGVDSWIGYVYATNESVNPPSDAFTAPYRGYITEPEIFNQDWGTGAVSGPNVCGSYTDHFSVKFKMQKNMPAGYYTFTVGGDDGYRLSIDGGSNYIINRWFDQSYNTQTATPVYLSGNVNFVLDFYEQGTNARVSFTYVACTDFSTPPTAISGTTSICNGTSTTLTATGGYAAAGSTYQWGTGTNIGSNVIGGNGVSITVNPTTNTTYWVRRADVSPCTPYTTGVTQLITVVAPSTQPTSISGTSPVCAGSNVTLTANGGTHASGASYQWGTGSIGNNIISGQSAASITVVAPAANTTYWVRRIDSGTCTTTTSGPTYNLTIATPSTPPTSITGTTTICSGSSTTLTASGGTQGTNTTYQWGTGTNIGSNQISGNGVSITVNPTTNTTYWVRRIDTGTCTQTTNGVTQLVTVVNSSVQPTSVTGTSTICSGSSTTLTANGGTVSAGSNGAYQWGTGWTAGQNIIASATSSTLTVSPTSNTTYWVRIMDGSPCNTPSWQGIQTITVNVTTATATAPTSISAGSTALCYGTGGTTLYANGGNGNNYQWGTGAVSDANVISGATSNSYYINPTTTTTYWVRRTEGAPCNIVTAAASIVITAATPSTNPTSITGNLNVCVGSSTVLTANGGTHATGAVYQWGTGYTAGQNIISGQSAASITIYPTVTSGYWVRRVDASPCNTPTSGLNVTVTIATPSTPPTSISGPATACNGSSITLTAAGGTHGSNATYEWGSGSIGSNVISGQNGVSVSVSPTANTTYWVRRIDTGICVQTTTAATLAVTVVNSSTQPTSLSGTSPICSGSSVTLTANGGVISSATGGAYQWGTGWTAGQNIISGATSSTLTVSPTSTTTYWVRIMDGNPCNTVAWQGIQTFTVNVTTSSVTAPTSISAGSSSLCYGTGGTTLWANGGNGNTYQWGTGTVSDANVISGATSNSYYINPTATTTYWVRRTDGAPCNIVTSAASITITAGIPSTQPTGISGTLNICPGSSTTLTATGGTHGTNATYQWGTGSVGNNVISGATGVSVTVSPTANTTYWVRRTNGSPCSGQTNGYSVNVTIGSASTAPTAVTGTNSICSGGSTTLTASGGTGVSGSSFEWGSGSVGSNLISGATSNTVTVSPTTTTTYWVRRVDTAPCVGPTSGFTYTVTVATPSVNPTSITGTTTICPGSPTTLTANGGTVGTGASYQWGTGSVGSNVISGATSNSISVSPTVNTTYWVRLTNTSPCSGSTAGVTTNVTMATAPTAPTSLSGTFTICNGSSTTLTVNGGVMGTNGTYEWGTGAAGSNVISGANSVSITVSPTATTTYWVRRKDAVCGTTTGAFSQVVTVTSTVAGTLSTTAMTICKNTTPNPIVLFGNTGNVIKWQYANDAAFTSGVTDIASTSTTLSSAQIGTLPATRYFRAVVQNGSCSVQNTAPISITVPAALTYNGSWNGTPDITTPVIIQSNLTLPANLSVCSCQVVNTAVVTIPDGLTLTVQHDISVASTGNIIVENNGSLVQIDDNGADVGTITVKRKTTPMKTYDYTYWTSPVQGTTIGQLSPNSISYQFSPTINNWSATTASTVMEVSKGYIIRAPQGWSTSNASNGIYQGVFNGVPNTGVVSVPIIKSSGVYNLIGNPYPSAIDIDTFILDPANSNVVEGTVYLWTHNTAISNTIPGNSVYNYSRDDYAKYNITGGVKTASAAVSGGASPTGKIASGQAFFIAANPALANGNYTATFRNAMRVAGNNSQFWRMASPATAASPSTIEKHRVWLHISNTTGAYDEMLLGYVQGATNDKDNLYDGKTFPAGNVVGIYSILQNENMSIQGRALPFNQSDIIPVGFTSTIGGTLSIGLENFDGLFNDQNVYLYDKTDSSYHDLKQGDFTFTAATGTIDNRFELRFTSQTLGMGDHTVAENDVKIIKSGHAIVIDAGSFNIAKVSVFDLTGKLVYSKKEINSATFTTSDLRMATQVILVKVLMETGETVTRKVIID